MAFLRALAMCLGYFLLKCSGVKDVKNREGL